MWDKDENIRNSAFWLSRKVELIEEKEKLLNRNKAIYESTGEKHPLREIYRGGVYWVEFGFNIGAEKNKTRPALIISPNHLNKGGTVIAIPLSTKFPYKTLNNGKIAPTFKNHYILDNKKYTALPSPSALKTEDIRCVDVVRVRDWIFNVDPHDMEKIKNRILYMCGYK